MSSDRPALAMPVPISLWQIGNLYREDNLKFDAIDLYIMYYISMTEQHSKFPCRSKYGVDYVRLNIPHMCIYVANYFGVPCPDVDSHFRGLCSNKLIHTNTSIFKDMSKGVEEIVGVSLDNKARKIVNFSDEDQEEAMGHYYEDHPEKAPIWKSPETTITNGWVYCIYSPLTKLVKIGKSENLPSRMSSIKASIGHSTELICAVQCSNYSYFESVMHKHYKKNRKDGEWFDLPQSEFCKLKPTLLNYIECADGVVEAIKEGDK